MASFLFSSCNQTIATITDKKYSPALLLLCIVVPVYKQMYVKRLTMRNNEKGKIGWIVLWLLGIPIPILLVLYFLRGCT